MVNTSGEETHSNARPKVGVVVSSGGIKSISSIALFEFLEEAGIEVDLLVACSAGSIFSGWWATCRDAAYVRENVESIWTRESFARRDYRTLLSIAGLPFGRFDQSRGLLKPHVVQEACVRMYGDQKMEELSIRTIFQATDLLSGEPVVLTTGLLRETVYASSALFPIFPAIRIDDRWLIDGVYSAPLPIMQAVMEGMDVIIAMTNEEVTQKESKGFIPYFMRASNIRPTGCSAIKRLSPLMCIITRSFLSMWFSIDSSACAPHTGFRKF